MKSYINKKYIALYFMPGIVVLIFGMLALHFTVSLIHSRSIFNENHGAYIKALTVFHKDYYDFTRRLEEYSPNDNGEGISALKRDLSLINDDYASLHNIDLMESEKNKRSDREHIFYLIGRGLQDIADSLILYEEKIGTPEEAAQRKELDDHIGDTMQVIVFLQDSVLRKYREVLNSEHISTKENWLYWSVIIMGLSGFVLVLINGRKLYEFKKLNEERHKVNDTLHKRLAAIEMANDGIIIIEKDENITFFNASLARILGIPEEKREGMYGSNWRNIFPEGDSENLNELIMPSLRAKWYWIGEFKIHRDDGAVIETEMSCTLLPDGGMIGTVQDITARNKAEAEKKEIEAQFYQAQKMEAIGRLAGGIAHDFNNILAAMNGYAEFLIEDLDDKSETQKFAQNILLAGKQAKDLVDQVLTFSRKSDTVQNVVDIVPILSEVQTMIGATMPKKIGLVSNAPSSPVYLLANGTQISQILMNLCVNAIDAMDEDYGDLSVSIDVMKSSDIEMKNIFGKELPDPQNIAPVRIQEEGPLRTTLILGHVKKNIDYAKISVSDTGTGMSRTIMEHIFEPFYTTKSVDEGTGLGLATVHGVVVSHRAMLTIRSELGKGTAFEMYFPIYKQDEDSDVDGIDDDFLIEDLIPDNKNNRQKKILLVEDQEYVLNMVTRMISRMGYEVYSATDGLDGLDIVRENPGEFDLVITDYNMPRMSGLEMTQQIYLDFPELPIILLSGYNESKIKELLNEHPSIKVALRKPVAKDVLEQHIIRILSANENTDVKSA